MKAVIVIPARLESTRLERKLLLNETGKPLLKHTWEQAKKTGLDVIVGTDSDEIWDACYGFGAHAIMTPNTCRNGTERVAEVAKEYPADVIVGWQADWPEINDSDVRPIVEIMEEESFDVATGSTPIPYSSSPQMQSRSCVKVVCDEGRALYFTRSPIDYGELHLGFYVYRRQALLRYANAPPTDLEKYEHLEQMRSLKLGLYMEVVVCADTPTGIDTREDYDAFVQRQKVMA